MRRLLLISLALGCLRCSRPEPPRPEPASAATQAPAGQATPAGQFQAQGNKAAGGIQVGSPAPEVSFHLQDGRTVALSSLRGKFVAVYFYPADATPGCTVEAQGIRDRWADLQAAGVVVIGVSGQDAESHKAFIAKEKLPYDLAVDSDGSVSRAFEVPMSGGFAARQTILVGKDGNVARVWRQVSPGGHAGEILAAAR
jgi:peroxiredoxin Q/BCP